MPKHLFDRRRLLAIGGIVLSLLIFFCIAVYAVSFARGLPPAVGSFIPLARDSGTPTPTPVPCTVTGHSPGTGSRTITSAGLRRSFLVHLPPSYGKYLQPLVVGYHGYSWTAQMMLHGTGLDAEADKAGFILVAPQGVDSPPSWNAGVGAYGPTGDADDIQFTRDLLGYLEKNYCIDTHRVYLAGFSLGGGMVYRLACTLSNQITAIATVSGAYYPFGGCKAARPLPVLEMHGAADTQAPYNGNTATRMAAVRDYLNVWLAQDKCSGTAQVFFEQGDVTASEWTHCAGRATVVHYRVSDGRHAWSQTSVVSTNEIVWQFFSRFSSQT